MYLISTLKIAVLIPDRNDRPLLLSNCLRMLKAQTLQPDHIEIVNDAPLSNEKDITYRYRTGYERLRNKGFDIIALIENDDYYHNNYLETMVNKWIEFGKPDMLGCDFTVYYHIKLFKWLTMYHKTRSSAMNMLIKPDLHFNWCLDSDPYTDIHLWKTLNGIIWHPPMICMGVKHHEGLHGGRQHTDRYDRYINDDSSKEFLKSVMDKESFEFYSNYYK